jgi:hypothetical protein
MTPSLTTSSDSRRGIPDLACFESLQNKSCRVKKIDSGMETIALVKIKKLIREFDHFERHPTEFERVDDLIEKADLCLEKCSKYDTDEAKAGCGRLRARKISLIYRLEMEHRVKLRDSIEFLHHELNKKLVDWVYEYKGYNPDTHDRDPEKKIIEVCEKYPLFAGLLLEDRRLLIDFFKWAVRDNNPVAPMVMFASLTELLKKCNLSQRTGYNKGCDILIHTTHDVEGHIIRTLAIPIEGKHYNIANQAQEVLLKDGTERTLEEIFDVFRNKVHGPSDLEFFPGIGVTYWPSYEPWKVMNFDDPRFWEGPPPLRIISQKEAREIYGETVPGIEMIETELPREKIIERDGMYWVENDLALLNEVEILEETGGFVRVRMRERIPVDGKNYINIVRATKERDMSFMKTHGFGDVLIPLPSGRYYLFSMGKYPKKYPESVIRLVLDFVNVVLAALQVVDDNVFFNHRNHTRECIGLKPEQGKTLLEIIRFLLILARDDKLGFEFQTEGCAKMEQVDIVKMVMLIEEEGHPDEEEIRRKIAEFLYSKNLDAYDIKNLPNFFRTTLDLVEPEGVLGLVLAFIKKFPYFMQPYMVTAVYLLTGVWRGMTFRIGGRDITLSHMQSSCFRDTTPYKHSLYHPGYLHYQQEQKGITLIKRKLHDIKLPFYK